MQGPEKKISEELMPIVWHPKRWWNFCKSEDEKNKNCNWRVVKEYFVSIQYGGVGVLEFKIYQDL